MARKPITKPRKQASQARSRATVEALVEATARILVRDGFDRASTNRIADVAGVGIGSLYQYYPSKEALVAAVVDRQNHETMQRVRAVLSEVASLPIEPAVRRLVAVAVEAHRIDPGLRRVLAAHVARVGRLESVEALDREGHALFRGYLESRRNELRVEDLDLAAFVCGKSLEALTHTAVDAGPLIEEATRFICGYLKPSPAASGKA